MYNRDHGPMFVKSLSKYARRIYKRRHSKFLRQQDKREVRQQ
jgi:hypothetical protein